MTNAFIIPPEFAKIVGFFLSRKADIQDSRGYAVWDHPSLDIYFAKTQCISPKEDRCRLAGSNWILDFVFDHVCFNEYRRQILHHQQYGFQINYSLEREMFYDWVIHGDILEILDDLTMLKLGM